MSDNSFHQSPDNVSRLALLWGKAQHTVSAYVYSAVRNHHDAEDVIQATVTYIAHHFDEYDPDRPFVAWACGIARYRILEYRHQNRRHPLLLEDDALEALSSAMSEQASVAEDRREALEHCMRKLKPDHRQALSDRYYLDKSRDEMAKTLGIKPRSVSVLLRRVRMVLAECISTRMKGAAS